MYDSKCHGGRNFKILISLKIFLITILMSFFLVPCTEAGYPVGDQVYVYDVGMTSFSVVWQVSEPSDYCTVLVYSDNSASPALVGDYEPTPWDGSDFGVVDTTKAQERGLMQVTITKLLVDTTYYIQTRSSETGSPNVFYDYPDFGSLIPVKTATVLTGSPPENGTIAMFLYDTEINPTAPTENLLSDTVLAIVSVEGGDYPVSSLSTNGWPSGDASIGLDLGPLLQGSSYYDLSTASVDRDISIMCFGGLVPDVGIGQRIIETTFPASMIGLNEGCLPGTANAVGDGFECFGDTFNQIALYTNRPPEMVITPEGPYTANPGETFTLQVCAYDPDGDAVTDIDLGGDVPSGMEPTFPLADANCASIDWTIPSVGGFFENIQIIATDGVTPKTVTFGVTVFNGPPTSPDVSISATKTPVTTDADLICTVDANSIRNPDTGQQIFIDYEWYEDGVLIVSNMDKTVYTDTLSNSETEKNKLYYCEVTVHDDDGYADPVNTSEVSVQNSPPAVPANAVVTPVDPETDQDLTCTVTPATVIDPDPEDVVSIEYKYRWTCTNCDAPDLVEHGPTTDLTDSLSNAVTDKNEQWKCEVLAWDGTDYSVTSITSDPVTIANKPATPPGDVQITTSTPVFTDVPLTCSVVGEPSNDPDGDDVYYVFKWNCTDCDDDPVTRSPKLVDSNTDTLEVTYTDKDEQWSCEVWAQDETGGIRSSSATTASVTIQNSPPEGLSSEVTPSTAYLNDELTCAAIGVTDEDGDTISYKYEWEVMVDGNLVDTITRDFQENKETDTIVADTQGETWSCTVTARDDDGAEVVAVPSNQVLIMNRPPEITTVPAGPHIWDEDVTSPYTIEIVVSDPDGNEFTLEMDTNYVDPDDPNVSEWIEFDPVTNILSATPPFGSSALDLGYGSGVLKFNFIVQETDGTPNLVQKEMITATIRFPALTVEDFEFRIDKPTLADNEWYKVQGTGNMLLRQEDPNDPNSNHFLKTTVAGTPTNNSQLRYIIYKKIPDNTFTNEYPVLQFSIQDMNRFYLDAYVRGINNQGQEDNFFLRFIPQDPNNMGWESRRSGNDVLINIGEESIDPNGDITQIERNMDLYLFEETGFHYLYLKAIVLRGDINFIDDMMVRSAPPIGMPVEVEGLDAVGSENQVTVQWTLPANQVENIAGYNIYMDIDNNPPKEEAFKIATVDPDITSHTETGLDNGVTYCFRVTAFNNLYIPDESEGVTDCATPQVTIPLDPEDVTIESIDKAIELTFKNPSNQYPDLAGYMIYFCDAAFVDCNAVLLVTPDKADSTGLFTQYITRDANDEYLEYGTKYNLVVKAMDTAQPPNFSDGVSVSKTLAFPTTKSIDNFELEEPLMRRGWYRLMGSGKFTQKAGTGINHYLEVKSNYAGASAVGYVIAKRLQDPTDFINPNFAARVRSLGNFQIILHVKGKDGKNYFLIYKADPNAEQDSPDAVEVAERWYAFTLGWQNKASSTEWFDVERNLDEDLMSATNGVEFDMLLNVVLKGTLDIDDLELGEGVLDAVNLTARAGDSSVALSWSLTDPNKIDKTLIYVDGNQETEIVVFPSQNDYDYEVTGLINNTSYDFKVVQATDEGDESKGVSVTATPRQYKTTFTFDDQASLDADWSLAVSDNVTFIAKYDSGVQSSVMYLDPPGDYPDRYYAANESIDVSDVTGMTCRIKTSTNFVIWFNIEDTDGLQFMLGFVPGGNEGSYSRFGSFGYYFLGQGLTDGNWHLLDLNLDDVMSSIITDVEADSIKGIYFGGRISVDDVSIY